MGETEEKKSDSWFLQSIIVCLVVVFFISFYFFYFKKDFKFIVETSCNPTTESCFQRDCTNPEDCPPNELSNFKRYSIKAKDFSMCANEDCTHVCESGQIRCEQIKCTENLETGESCIYPVSQ